MKNVGKSVLAASAAVAFAAGSALAAPAAGAQSSLPALPTGSLDTSSLQGLVGGGQQCGPHVVTPENAAGSGWTTPGDETPATIAAVTGAPAKVGPAALTFPKDTDAKKGTSLYKDAKGAKLSTLIADGGKTIPMSFDYLSTGQAPALQIRLQNASVDKSKDKTGFATIVWSPVSGDGTWKAANPGETEQFWVTRDVLDAQGTKILERGKQTNLKKIVELNPDATISGYGFQKTHDNQVEGTAVDNVVFGCEATNFDLTAPGGEGVWGSLTAALESFTTSLSGSVSGLLPQQQTPAK